MWEERGEERQRERELTMTTIRIARRGFIVLLCNMSRVAIFVAPSPLSCHAARPPII